MKKRTSPGKLAWTLFILVFCASTITLNAQQERNHKNFSAIHFSISGDLYLTQGNSYSVKLEGNDSDLEKVITKVENGNLIVKTNNNTNLKNKVVVYITLPEINEISVAGSGDVYAKKEIKAGNMEISLSGSGDILFNNLLVTDIEISIAGSGDIEIAGKAKEELEVNIAGSGDVAALNFEAKDVEINISGSGSAKVYAIDNLETNIVGSGSVRYKGNPLVNASAIGSGSTRPLE